MLTPDQVAALRDAAGQLADPINDFLISDIARRISEAGQLTSTASYQIWRARNLGLAQKEIDARLQKELKVTRGELERLLTQSAEVGYRFDLDRLGHAGGIAFSRNSHVQQIVAAAVKQAQGDFTNLTGTLGMVDPFGRVLPLQDVYRANMDFAFEQVMTGAADYNTAVRRAVRYVADAGVQVIDYESGVHTSLEAATRRCVMGGLGLLTEQIAQDNHDKLGADGWEITAHANSAPDHEPIQGKQYSDKEFQALNSSLKRRIGTLNCGHMAFSVLLGVNAPQYTEEELRAFREENERGITYEGRHYTGYEATQMQRRIEQSIRKQKRRVVASEASDDAEQLAVDKTRLTRLNQEYARFSKAAGLRTERERTWVQVAKPPQRDIIKNIDIDDMQAMAYGKDIDESVIQTIYDTIRIGEDNGDYYINEVFIGSLPRNGSGMPLFQIEPLPARGAAMLRLNINSDLISGKSLAEINNILFESKDSISNTIEEALVHETGHAKLIFRRSISEIQTLYRELEGKGVAGISACALRDGAECIAETEVLIHRGGTVPEEAMRLYRMYIGGVK